ncbi:hypothetical protein QJS10_CPB19g00279 [Acorus calamus]|uniref:Uncharacterized protein n=1 Tax=Acorus calamus TaxID=4465 RepID=A0AAV9CHD1_ACOCL|nr:hypothetical protein QJS10_CPB19g00279 [Acorus calamus]
MAKPSALDLLLLPFLLIGISTFHGSSTAIFSGGYRYSIGDHVPIYVNKVGPTKNLSLIVDHTEKPLTGLLAAEAACGPSDIAVSQSRTGRLVQSQAEYAVSVTNQCVCSQSNVVLHCDRLNSVEAVDPKIIRPLDGQNCIVNDGGVIAPRATVSFNYAWKSPADYSFVNSQPTCD